MSKKAFSEIIAMILIVMLAVSAASLFFHWYRSLQTESQGNVEASQEKILKDVNARIDALKQHTTYNATEGNLTLFIKNSGRKPITTTASGIYWLLQDSEKKVLCSTNWTSASQCVASSPVCCAEGCASELRVNELRKLKLQLTIGQACDISTKPYNALFHYTIDFNKATTLSNYFRKS
jgi:archaellum component FlaG (FlaF/FlaG flagellin family)